MVLMIGIYAIRNTQNSKMYIGESIDIEKRWKSHQEDLDNGNHHSYKLQEDYNKSKSKEFRFFVLEEFIFPFNAKIDATKLQLILYCREYYYMKKYKSKSEGYNVESTLKEIVNIHNEQLKYPKYQTEACRNFILDNKDILTTDSFNLNILNELCIYTEKDKLGDMVYINANSSPQSFNPYLNAYTDKKATVIPKSKNNKCDTKPAKPKKTKKDKKEPVVKEKQTKKPKVLKDESLIPITKMYTYLDEDFKAKFSFRTLMSIDIQNGFIQYDSNNEKRHYSLTSKGIESGYFVLGDPHINGYNKDSILLTSLGLNRYQEMARQIYDYVSPEMLSTNAFGKFYIPIDTLVNDNNNT